MENLISYGLQRRTIWCCWTDGKKTSSRLLVSIWMLNMWMEWLLLISPYIYTVIRYSRVPNWRKISSNTNLVRWRLWKLSSDFDDLYETFFIDFQTIWETRSMWYTYVVLSILKPLRANFLSSKFRRRGLATWQTPFSKDLNVKPEFVFVFHLTLVYY